jgi:hypothetical protein
MMGDSGTSTKRSTGKDTLGAMLLAAAERHEGAALRYKAGDDWRDVSYAELAAPCARSRAG